MEFIATEFEGYSVTRDGQIRGRRGTIMKWQYNKKNGYYWVKIQLPHLPCKARTVYVHYLVCTTFHGPRPPGKEVCHRDENKAHNSACNLFWGSHSHNQQSMWDKGARSVNRGWRHAKA